MRFSLAVAVVVIGISISGLGQQSKTFKVKHSDPEKAPKKSAVVSTPGSTATASAANSRALQSVEHQGAKVAPSRPVKKSAPGPSAVKPVKDKPNAPINFGGTGGKNAGLTNQGANPYKGRLRQKRTH